MQVTEDLLKETTQELVDELGLESLLGVEMASKVRQIRALRGQYGQRSGNRIGCYKIIAVDEGGVGREVARVNVSRRCTVATRPNRPSRKVDSTVAPKAPKNKIVRFFWALGCAILATAR